MYWLSVAGVTPAAAAFSWSTTIVADGRPSLRFEVTSASPSTVFTSASTMSLASLSTTGSLADTRTSMSDMPPMDEEESSPVTLMVPASVSAETPSRT